MNSREPGPLYTWKRARDIAAVGPRRKRADLLKAPLRPFPVIRGDGELALDGAKPGRIGGAWGTYSVTGAVCLYPSMVLVAPGHKIIGETLNSLKAFRSLHGLRHKPDQTALEALRNGQAVHASFEPKERLDGTFFLLGSAPVSYFHWLIEYLPNLVFWREVGGNCRLLVPELRHRWQRETLAYAGVRAEEIVELKAHTLVTGDLTFADRVNPTEAKMSRSIAPFFRSLRACLRTPDRVMAIA